LDGDATTEVDNAHADDDDGDLFARDSSQTAMLPLTPIKQQGNDQERLSFESIL
jgi:hypothetical protein